MILTFLNQSLPTSLEKNQEDGFEGSYFRRVFNSAFKIGCSNINIPFWSDTSEGNKNWSSLLD